MKQYKIGEFARELGVTPDLLKHYETFGLVKPIVSESGYRYYQFPESNHIIRCLKLRNLGFSLKEIEELLTDYSFEKILDACESKKKTFNNLIKEYQLKIHYIDQIANWRKLSNSSSNWSIEVVEPFYYYKHTFKDDFISDYETQEVTKSWMEWLPIVTSTAIFDGDCEKEEEFFKTFYWGFSVNCELAEELELKLNPKVHKADLGLCLIHHYNGPDPLFYPEKKEYWSKARFEIPMKILKEHNFQINGKVFQIFHSNNTSGKAQEIQFTTIIPIK
ncbi:MAG: MerR family transcriptional regulator [Erysipelotrichales bacterium]|nr:MerR family transcriptional regulator [Erysipelotrichales bacterium]